jgi:hypothetical protein
VRVNVDFDWRVHANDAEAANDFGAVADLLGAQEQFGRVLVPVLVEALEAVRREADGCCRGEVEVARVEEVEERVLEDFGPDFEVFEVCAAGLETLADSRMIDLWRVTYGETTNYGVGDVSDTGLDGQQVFG